MKTINVDALQTALWKAVEFHRNNPNDPHGIGTAVMCALAEVSMAIEKAANETQTVVRNSSQRQASDPVKDVGA